MKFRFNRSGGFASLKYATNNDSKNLSVGSRKVLESLVKPSNNIQFKKPNPLARDVFNYHLEIDNNGQTNSYDFSDDTIPAQLESLIEELSAKLKMVQ